MKKISYINEWNKQANLNPNLRYVMHVGLHVGYYFFVDNLRYGLTFIYFKPIYLNARNTGTDI